VPLKYVITALGNGKFRCAPEEPLPAWEFELGEPDCHDESEVLYEADVRRPMQARDGTDLSDVLILYRVVGDFGSGSVRS